MTWDRKVGSSGEGWQSQMGHEKGQNIPFPLKKISNTVLYCIVKSHHPPLQWKVLPPSLNPIPSPCLCWSTSCHLCSSVSLGPLRWAGRCGTGTASLHTRQPRKEERTTFLFFPLFIYYSFTLSLVIYSVPAMSHRLTHRTVMKN